MDIGNKISYFYRNKKSNDLKDFTINSDWEWKVDDIKRDLWR